MPYQNRLHMTEQNQIVSMELTILLKKFLKLISHCPINHFELFLGAKPVNTSYITLMVVLKANRHFTKPEYS